MPLGTRELLLVIRARDVASRVVREVGTNLGMLGAQGQLTGQQMMSVGAALTAVGVTIGAAGAAGLAFLNDATDAAIEYNRQAALTKTQVDDVGVSVSDLADIGRRVAAEIPAPFDQMQTALYDIFSSMNVNVVQAEELLRGFSKSAVAGQVDIQTAARSSISIMNAYQLPISDLAKIMDIQFQLVRKGVGTYEEFNTSLGRAIPAAVSAGQSFETLAGMMAFLTRNGLSTEMAATSAARALELFSDPDKFKALEDLGITVRDSSGQFLQMNDIISQLATNQGWAQMAEPDRKQMFEEIFGQGTIQARRFFDLAIPNFGQLNDLTGSMYDSAGALEGAYDTMFGEPASQAQLLRNQYEILKTEIGDELIPIKLKLMEHIQKLIDWWNGLSESTQDTIIKITLFTSTALLVVGVVLTVIGAVVMLIGGIMLLGTTVGGAILIIGGIIAALAAAGAAVYALVTGNEILLGILALIALPITAIVTVVYLLATQFERIKSIAIDVWGNIQQWASTAWQTMQDFWDWVTRNAVSVWHTMYRAASTAWAGVKTAGETLWGWFQTAWQWLDDHFGDGFRQMWDTIWTEVGAVLEEVGETVSAVIGYITTGIAIFWAVSNPILAAFIAMWPLISDAIGIAVEIVTIAFGIMWAIISTTLSIIITVIEFFVGLVKILWDNFGTAIINTVVLTWNFIASTISAGITIISNVIQLVLNIIQGDWGEAWDNIKNIFGAAWDAIWAALTFVWGLIANFFVNVGGNIVSFIGDVVSLLWQKGWDIMTGLWNGLVAVWNGLYAWVTTIPGAVSDLFLDAVDWLWDAGWDIIQGLIDGMKAAWEEAADWLGSLGGGIINLKGPPAKDRALLKDNGKLIMQGLHAGMQEGWKDVEGFLRFADSEISGFGSDNVLTPAYSGVGASSGSRPSESGASIGFYVENLNVREENVASDMDWWYTTASTGV